MVSLQGKDSSASSGCDTLRTRDSHLSTYADFTISDLTVNLSSGLRSYYRVAFWLYFISGSQFSISVLCAATLIFAVRKYHLYETHIRPLYAICEWIFNTCKDVCHDMS